jgi:demethylphylloquinone reductase
MTQPKKICILGGGFGGLYTALRLNELPWEEAQTPEIVLIDQSDRFLFSPLLYELVTGELQSWEIAPPFEEILADTKINFYQDRITAINLSQQQVQLENRGDTNYDYLVIALGSKTPLESVSGVKMNAMTFRTLEDAYRLKEKLRILEQTHPEKIRIALVGGGYSGVELACKLSDRLGSKGRLRIITRGEDILKNASDFNREAAKKALTDRKIWIDLETEVEAVNSNSMTLLYKGQRDIIPVDLILWTVGNQVCDLIQNLPLLHNNQGKLITNNYLQIKDYQRIFALGDGAECQELTNAILPTTAQVAIQQADYCAWNIWATINNKPLLPFRYQSLGEMLTLGLDNATLSGLGIKLEGPVAHLARRLVYLYRLPTFKHQISVGLNWLTKPLADLLKTA